MRDFDAPSYDSDDETANGFPPGVAEFRRRLQSCDAFVISSPEYNASTPGGLKNLIDWTSRFHPQPFNERYGLLLSASPSMVGGNRGLWALRVPFEHLGARIYPDSSRSLRRITPLRATDGSRIRSCRNASTRTS